MTDAVFDEERERRVAWRLILLVLVTLTVVKPLGNIPYVGTAAFTVAALMQLYLPLWRAEKLGRDYDFVGLTFAAWKADARNVAWLCLITFPPYVLLHHIYMVYGHDWLVQGGLPELARYVSARRFGPRWPTEAMGWGVAAWASLETIATHSLGVALPEETFYRGYVQPRLEGKWPPTRRFWGVPLGRAALLTNLFFALGHVLGEWNPMRLGPFFPGLIFSWLRNRSGTVLGAITYHALCNLLGEFLFTLYQAR